MAALHDRIAGAAATFERLATEVTLAGLAVTTAEGVVSGLGDRAELVRLLDAHDRGAALHERRVKGEVVVAERRADVVAASDSLNAATAILDSARADEEAIAAAHRAHAVRADLVAGDACPVCLQTVAAVPRVKAPIAMTKAKTAREIAEREWRLATEAQSAADKALAVAEAAMQALDADLAEVSLVVDGAPERAEVQRVLDAHAKATTDLEACRAALAHARAEHAGALAERDSATTEEQAARAAYDDARDVLAALKPPTRRRESATLLEEWAALVEWASQQAETRTAAALESEAKASAIATQLGDLIAALAQRCASADLVVPVGREPIAAAREALGRASADHDTLVARAADAAAMRAELVAVEGQRELAHGSPCISTPVTSRSGCSTRR